MARENGLTSGVAIKGTSGGRYGEFVMFLLRSALVGAAAGLIAVLFRLALDKADLIRDLVAGYGRSAVGFGRLALPLAAGVAGGLAGWFTGFAPESAGSGIPHVEAVLNRERELRWWRLIPVKFVAGMLALGSGLSLGREGPTVQMGAAAGQAVSRSLNRPLAEELQLVACGAGAGLAAAFNAPLAGVVFVLEELRRNFSPYVLGGAIAASIAADIVSLYVLGPFPSFRVAAFSVAPPSSFPLFLILGAVAGTVGAAFNRSLRDTLAFADRLRAVPRWARAAALAVVVGALGCYLPQVLGGGHSLVDGLLAGQIGGGLLFLALLLIAKFLITMGSYSVGVPGGIFLPLLTIGALLGAVTARLGEFFFTGAPGLTSSLIVVGMAASFVAIVRAPLTGIILLTEMTGRYQHMLPLLLACITAYVVAEAWGSLPVYESLLEREMAKSGASGPSPAEETAIIEMSVETGAPAGGCQVRDLDLPADCLLVSVRKGTREVIPRGHTRLAEGDMIQVIVPVSRFGAIKRELAKLVSCHRFGQED